MKVQVTRQITRGDLTFEVTDIIDRPDKVDNKRVILFNVVVWGLPMMLIALDSLAR